jgi:hypothetical protein
VSNFLAIATVTQTLSNVLQAAINADGANLSGAVVKFARPDDAANLPDFGVNVFLYQVAPNPALRNSDLPTRTADGTLLQRPQAALDLFYLLTFYGDDSKFEQQRLLGAVTLALHAQPWLTVQDITDAQSGPYLGLADLSTQSERVRFRPVSFSLEELSKLWSFLLKTDYVLSAAYVASTVLLQTDDAEPAPGLPVLKPVLATFAAALPTISAIMPAVPNASGAILPGAQVNLQGANLLGPTGTATVVLVGGAAITPSAATAEQLTLTLPATLNAGPQTLAVVQQPLLGSPPVAHAGGAQSAPAAFVQAPLIRRSAAPVVYEITVAAAAAPAGDTIAVTFDPTAAAGQRILLSLTPAAAGSLPLIFDGGAVPAPTNVFTFPVGDPAAGSYFVQLIVDGATSPFDVDVAGNPTGPQVSL